MPATTLNRWLGGLALLLCCAMLFVWIPLDVDSGIVEKVRRQVRLGDAFAPSIAALMIGLGGVLLLLQKSTAGQSDRQNLSTANPPATALLSESTPANEASGAASVVTSGASVRLLRRSDFFHAFIILILASVAIFLMRYLGPLVLHVVDGGASEYRLLRDTVPWKYIGFSAGGIFLIVALIAYTEKRLRPIHFLTAILVVLLLIAFYDLPFDDLLLPPNGDV